MVNIYLFIELIRAASAPDVAEHIKSMSLDNCKFANVVVLSYDKLRGAARLPDAGGRHQGGAGGPLQGRGRGADQCHRRREARAALIVFKKDPEILDWKHKSFHESICGRRLCRVLQSVSSLANDTLQSQVGINP
jgi:hypothetical protein